MKVFIFVLFPKMKFHLICNSPRWRFSSYMLLPVVKALIFCARPQDEGLNWPHTIISWACMVGLLDSSIINPLLLLLLHLRFICSFRILIMLCNYVWYCFYRVLNRYRLMIPYDWHHRCVLLLGGYRLWVWYNACQPCQGRIVRVAVLLLFIMLCFSVNSCSKLIIFERELIGHIAVAYWWYKWDVRWLLSVATAP